VNPGSRNNDIPLTGNYILDMLILLLTFKEGQVNVHQIFWYWVGKFKSETQHIFLKS